MTGDPQAFALAALALAACGVDPAAELPAHACIEEVLSVDFDATEVDEPEVHAAVAQLPRVHVHEGTYYDLGTTTAVTTRVELDGSAYTLTRSASDIACLVALEIPVRVRVESADGQLRYDERTIWGQSRAIFPDTFAEDIVLGALRSTETFADWVEIEVAEVWPEVVGPDDDAQLKLLMRQQGGELVFGELSYARRTVVDEQTLIWEEIVLLAWGPAPPSAGP